MEGLTTRRGTIRDLPYVMSLMRKNRESVGGLPSPAIAERLERGTVEIAFINRDPVGYVLFDIRNGMMRIPQACIQYDARRRAYGVALMSSVISSQPDIDKIHLRCAADLEANLFWRAMGFTCIGTVAGGVRRGRPINIWAMWLGPMLLDLAQYGVKPAAAIRQDSMYDDSGFLMATPAGFSDAILLPKLAWSNRRSPKA